MTVDAIIIDNLTVQSIEIGYQSHSTRRSELLAPSGHLVLQGVHKEQLAENILTIMIPRGYLRVRYLYNLGSIPKGLSWVLTGAQSRCASTATVSSNTDRTITGTAFVHPTVTFNSMNVTHATNAYTITGTAVGTESVTKTGIRAGIDLKTTVTVVSAVTKTSIRAGFDLKNTATGTESVTFVGMTVTSAASTWDPTFTGATTDTYSNGNKTVLVTNSTFAARGTKTQSTGKWYFEIGISQPTPASNANIIAGIIDNTATGTVRLYEGSTHFTFDWVGGSLYALSYNGSNLSTLLASGLNGGSSPGYPNGTIVVGFAVDLNTPLVRLLYLGNTYSSPYLPIAGHLYRPGCTQNGVSGGVSFALNTAGPFVNTVPTGFSAWG